MPAGNVVELGDHISRVSEDEVRTNHFWDGEGESSFSLHGHEFARFAAIKEFCDPSGLAPADTEAIELITGADKSEESVSQLFKLFSKLPADHKGVRRNAPRLLVKEAAFWQSGANGFRTLGLLHVHAKIFRAILTNSSAASDSGASPRHCLIALWASICL